MGGNSIRFGGFLLGNRWIVYLPLGSLRDVEQTTQRSSLKSWDVFSHLGQIVLEVGVEGQKMEGWRLCTLKGVLLPSFWVVLVCHSIRKQIFLLPVYGSQTICLIQ
ncbi:hypothetical protein CEXT_476791 [Caerostris extrusa]|uniref:Uncharacterized protein n=1 Tax=Caerostris extrusa TaxID=172846 RepID=A0AAV4VJA3_CAEEX|nr:hypothetical protein CEXT_476791 [Caerostris extrusa]